MLTATYTLVALSVEQASVRASVQSFQKYLQSNFVHHSSLRRGQLNYACDAMQRLYQTCHWRKIELYLIPAIRSATVYADGLLAELAELNAIAAAALARIEQRLCALPIDTEARVAELCEAIGIFCTALLNRLEKEEKELFPVARAAISGETWFSIANQLLMHDAQMQESRRDSQVLPQALAVLPLPEFDDEPPEPVEGVLRALTHPD